MSKTPDTIRHLVFPRALAHFDVSSGQLRELVLSVLEPATRERADALPTSEWDELAEVVQTNLGQAKALYNWSHYRTNHNDFAKRLRLPGAMARDFFRSIAEFNLCPFGHHAPAHVPVLRRKLELFDRVIGIA